MRKWLLLPLFALAILLTANQDRAGAALYWVHGFSSFGTANVDGGQPLWPLPNGSFPALEASGACGLEVDERHLYWGDTSEGAVGRAAIDGTASNQAFIRGLGAPCGVAVTATHVYWSDFATNMIGRARLDGSGVEPGFVVGASDPCGVAVDSTHLYWANQDAAAIGRAALDGSDADQQFISGLGSPCGVAVGGGRLYWGDQESESIGSARLDGADAKPQLISHAGEPWDLAVSDTHVYWADRWGTQFDPDGGIGRASLEGSGANRDLVPGTHNSTGVALDDRARPVPQVPLRPSDYLRFGKLTHDKRTGAVTLVVHVPARGDFRVDTPRIGWSIDKGNPPPWVGGTFRWKLRLWPGKGPASKRVRQQLRRTGRAPIVLRVTYQQEGRAPLQGSKRFALVRERKRPRRSR